MTYLNIQKGFAIIFLVLALLLMSAIIIGGSFLLKGKFSNNSKQSLPETPSPTSTTLKTSSPLPSPPKNEVKQSLKVLKTIKLAVILVKFQDTTSDLYSISDVKNLVFDSATSIKKFYEEASFGQLSISGDVLGWYTIQNKDTANCLPSNWAADAEQVAKNQGVDLGKYTNFLFLVPDLAICQQSGATGGAQIGNIGEPKAWARTFEEHLLAHELGHTLNLAHAVSLKCGNLAIDDYSKCVEGQYGDTADLMGAESSNGNIPLPLEFNALHKIALGFIPASNIKTVTQNGTYTLTPLETFSSDTQVIKIKKRGTGGTNPDDNYYLEYRQQVGDFDKYLPPTITRGVTIHIWDGQANHVTKLIDTTPGSCHSDPTNNTGCNNGDFSDAALSDGASFTDPVSWLTITQIGHNNKSATISIKFDQ